MPSRVLPFVIHHSSFIISALLLPFIIHHSSFIVPAPCLPARPIAIDHWRGEYFNNRELAGSPAMVRDDGVGAIEFDWGLGGPASECNVNVDEFSARWTRTIPFGAGVYRFTLTADDGVRLFIDGQEKFARWTDHALTTHEFEVALTAGNHKITLEYYERLGSAIVRLRWEGHPCIANVAPDHWRGEYFSNPGLTGPPVLVRDEGDRSPLIVDAQEQGANAACGVPNGGFSARWTRKASFGQGAYRFQLAGSGGMRVYVDGRLRFEDWSGSSSIRSYFDLQLEGGNHLLAIEYRAGAGRGPVSLEWRPLPCLETVADAHWRGEYFNTDDLSGAPVMVRDDGESATMEFNWGEESPSAACGVNRDGFSARWTRSVQFTRGVHRFIVAGNDGLRLYIDGQLRLEQWREQSARFIVDADLTEGTHRITLEYADFGGRANVRLSWQPPPCVEPVPGEHWRGEYFNNLDLAGRPSVVHDEGAGAIDFDWGLAAPNPACSSRTDEFSARWSRTAAFATGTYRFTVTGDDGVRLRIDGRTVLDAWRDQSLTTRTIDLEMAAGKHLVVLEYFDRFGSAAVRLSWATAPCTALVSAERWRGEYFNNPALEGKPAMTRDDGAESIDFDWGLKSPESNCGAAPDNFSARWTRTASFGNGIYRFDLTADDGVRVYIDRQLRFERWTDQAASHSFDVAMTAGNHLIVVEYFERFGSAILKLRWDRHPCFADVPPDRWRGEYFNTPTLAGAPVMIRDDGEAGLNFDWGLDGPAAACGVNADDFSVRWSRRILLDTGWHRFTVTADDGARLLVNGRRVIDQWRNQAPATFTADLRLPAGRHLIVLEYYDHTAGATARLAWEPIVGPQPPRRAAGIELRTPRP
ncbi:MAG: PA14 domain-containing protein [Blastocatellia bacterium]|nr:PA14 domain-containing protein [Blastocatellia bacterium]